MKTTRPHRRSMRQLEAKLIAYRSGWIPHDPRRVAGLEADLAQLLVESNADDPLVRELLEIATPES